MRRARAISPFSPPVRNSVSPPVLDPRSVPLTTHGAIDLFDWVDGLRGLLPRLGRPRVPVAAPLVVSGWAVDPTSDAPPTAVALVIDGERVYDAEVGFDRTDVQALLGRQTPPMIGFRALISDTLPIGGHVMQSCALGADGQWYLAGQYTFWVSGAVHSERGRGLGAVRINVDHTFGYDRSASREDVVPLGDVALISGWAIDLGTRMPPAGMYAADERGGSWSTLCDVPRADVRAAIGADTDLLGFEIGVPTGALGLGRQKLVLGAFDAAGRPLGSVQDVEFEVAAERRPFPGFARLSTAPVRSAALIAREKDSTMLEPSRTVTCERGDILAVEGWAVAVDGDELHETAQIFLELHPQNVEIPPFRYQAMALYRRERPLAKLPEPPREDAWFSYSLDTSNLAPRTYALRIAVVRAGRCFYARGELGSVRVVEPANSPGEGRRR